MLRLWGLFALDSFGGGFVVQSFIAFWLSRGFEASTAAVGAVFFGVGVVQTAPFLVLGTVKSACDLMLWRWFRRVPLRHDAEG